MQVRRRYFLTAGITKNPATQKFYIHFFIDNSNANISLYALSCPKLKFGQLKAYILMFAFRIINEKMNKKILDCLVFGYTRS